ncbi:hypothetical protein N657DRAFT_692509 [Parathielavia appendiculata]|uniref:Uncharacterized protein n=1 Tax=Parathielavia appendiculata TaxID=2587402 RepID=A0AAN6TUY5_9PEZI|nr:hypothetical protein N657DRAFT_692509 [Parathielavia appendiculata]
MLAWDLVYTSFAAGSESCLLPQQRWWWLQVTTESPSIALGSTFVWPSPTLLSIAPYWTTYRRRRHSKPTAVLRRKFHPPPRANGEVSGRVPGVEMQNVCARCDPAAGPEIRHRVYVDSQPGPDDFVRDRHIPHQHSDHYGRGWPVTRRVDTRGTTSLPTSTVEQSSAATATVCAPPRAARRQPRQHDHQQQKRARHQHSQAEPCHPPGQHRPAS